MISSCSKLCWHSINIIISCKIFTFRNDFGLRANRNWKDLHNGRNKNGAWVKRNHSQFFCTYIWLNCKNGWRRQVCIILFIIIHSIMVLLRQNISFCLVFFKYQLKVNSSIFRFLVRVSYLEIYNENVRDLLGKDQKAKLEVSYHSICWF